jgi:hypothetical protein
MPDQDTAVDKWRIWTDTIDRKEGATSLPSAMITLEVQITRRISLPSENRDNFGFALRSLGLADVHEMLEALHTLPPNLRELVRTDWQPASPRQLSLATLTDLCRASERKMTWRLESTFSPGSACVAVLSCGGYEIRVPFSESELDGLESRMHMRMLDAEAVLASTSSTQAERDAAEVALNAAACFVTVVAGAITRDPATIIGAAATCYTAYKQIMDAIDEAAKKAAEQKAKDANKAGSRDSGPDSGEVVMKVGDMWIR